MIHLFNKRWDEVPTVWIDTETTGTKPGVDKAVQVAVVRFEGGVPVDSGDSEINPGIPIPAEASAIHGVTDDMVKDAPTIEQWFAHPSTRRMLEGAQPGGYNCPFDRCFVDPAAFPDFHWPWLDTLTLVRAIDRFERGKGRHKLEAACERHGVVLDKAHTAAADAEAAGRLFYRLAPKLTDVLTDTIGDMLRWQRVTEANEWHRFHSWLSKQPPRLPTDLRPAFDPEARNG